MIINSRPSRLFSAALVAALLSSLALTETTYARAGATDPIPGTSKSGLNGGGGAGGRSSIPVAAPSPAPTPAPAPQPIVSAQLTFSPSGPISGIMPQCTGSYHIDPYYPTLSLLTVDVSASSVNVPDGTTLYITVVGTGGTLYPFTSNVMTVTAQAGSCSHSVYDTLGTVITGVLISDISGNILFAGN